MGEVKEFDDAVDHAVAQRDQGIERADEQPVPDELSHGIRFGSANIPMATDAAGCMFSPTATSVSFTQSIQRLGQVVLENERAVLDNQDHEPTAGERGLRRELERAGEHLEAVDRF